jgi:hypothetical protein
MCSARRVNTNVLLNFFENVRFIFTISRLVVSAYLSEAIPDNNTDFFEPPCSKTGTISVGPERKFVSYSETLSNGRDFFRLVNARALSPAAVTNARSSEIRMNCNG